MHPVANEVPVSTEQILELLRPYAVPGFTGQVRVPVRVKPEAALDLEFGPAQVTESQGTGSRARSQPWAEINSREPTEREMKVAVKLAENASRFKLGMKITAIVAYFGDGGMNRFDLEMIG